VLTPKIDDYRNVGFDDLSFERLVCDIEYFCHGASGVEKG